MRPRERWECCGKGTRLKICTTCGAEAPWANLMLREPAPAHLGVHRDQIYRCKGCGKELNDLGSIERGYGPTCWSVRQSIAWGKQQQDSDPALRAVVRAFVFGSAAEQEPGQ